MGYVLQFERQHIEVYIIITNWRGTGEELQAVFAVVSAVPPAPLPC